MVEWVCYGEQKVQKYKKGSKATQSCITSLATGQKGNIIKSHM